ncbi:MAG: TrmB family transcriptional regulator [Nanoarchaeota archaeon]
MQDKEIFEELGLSHNESKVYKTLIKFGKLSSSEISAKSEVPYGRVYDVLKSLIEKGLVKIVPEKTKKFIPTNPESFIEIISKKEEKLKKAKEKIKELKKFYETEDKNPVTITYGEKGFWKIGKELITPEDYHYSIQWTSNYKPDNALKIKKEIKKGVDIKTLNNMDKNNEKDIRLWNKINKNMRILENSGFACDIRDDKEVMLGLIKSNTTLLIKNKEFAKIMKKLFLAYYNKAKKIEFS